MDYLADDSHLDDYLADEPMESLLFSFTVCMELEASLVDAMLERNTTLSTHFLCSMMHA